MEGTSEKTSMGMRNFTPKRSSLAIYDHNFIFQEKYLFFWRAARVPRAAQLFYFNNNNTFSRRIFNEFSGSFFKTGKDSGCAANGKIEIRKGPDGSPAAFNDAVYGLGRAHLASAT